MFCPQCQTEYRTGFNRCSDCDVELVNQRPPDAVHSGEARESGYIVVATVQGPVEEGQICSFLEANSIPAQVQGEAFRKAYAVNINGIGAVQILVPRELAGAALDLLAKADHGDFGIDAGDDESSTQENQIDG